MTNLPITPGCVVLLASFDDIPAHQFLVQEVSRGLHHRHCPHRSPCGGIRRTRHCVGSAGPSGTNLARAGVREGLSPCPSLALLTKSHPSHKPGQLPQKGDVMSPQIKYAYKTHNTWVYRRTYPKTLQPLLGSALKQSLKTGDATQAKTRVAELNQTFTTIIKEAQAHALATPHTATATAAQGPRLAVGRPRYQRARLVGERLVADLATSLPC